MAIIYGELHKLAKSHLRRAQFAGTLQPTVIVHEAYLRLVGREPDSQSRSHFFGIASRLMRQIVHARARVAVKRGDGQTPLELNEALKYSDAIAGSVVALDDALQDWPQLTSARHESSSCATLVRISVATTVREARYRPGMVETGNTELPWR